MDLFEGYSPDQLRLIDQLRQAARQKAAADQAAEVAAESLRRLKTLGFWQRTYVNTSTWSWSTAGWLLFALSKLSVPRIPNGA